MRRLLLVLLIVGCGCSGGGSDRAPAPRVLTEVEMVAAMENHYTLAIEAHDALIRGDLAGVRMQLKKLSAARLPGNAPQRWLPLQGQLRSAALRGAEAGNLAAAASGLAAVAESCGNCHTALITGSRYPAPGQPDSTTEVESKMQTHQWASERLWEGITGPWDHAWKRGTALLASADVFQDEVSQDMKLREAALRRKAAEAGEATTHQDRARLYGELLIVCAACHQKADARIPLKHKPPTP